MLLRNHVALARRTSSTVGIGCLSLSMASFARLISTHSLISPDGFGTTQTGLPLGGTLHFLYVCLLEFLELVFQLLP